MEPMLEKLEYSLNSSSCFTHTDTTAAEAFLEEVKTEGLEKICVAIVGDDDITDARSVSKLLNLLLRHLGGQEYVRILTGGCNGVESIARRWAKKNNFELDVYPIIEKPEWSQSTLTNRQDRDNRMLVNSHIVVVITKPMSKVCDFMYTNAVDAGRLVTKRVIRDK